MVKIMLARTTIIHQHTRRLDRHFDWMIDDPTVSGTASTRKLVTFRMHVPTWQWADAKALEAAELPLHRRAYLTMQANRLSDGRGCVVAVDRGRVVVRQWARDRRVLEVQMQRFAGVVEMRRAGPRGLWRVKVLQRSGAGC